MTALRKLSLADLFTLANALLGFLAITYVVDGEYELAGSLVFAAILLDGLDGAVARKFGSKHQSGRYLDFFADSVSFCFAPATLAYTVTYDISRGSAWVSWENAVAVVLPTFYVCMGLLRLARFAEEGFQKAHFEGLPTPASAFLVLTVYLLLSKGRVLLLGSQLSILIVMGFAGSMMISGLEYPKLEGILVPPTLLAVLVMIAASLVMALEVEGLESFSLWSNLLGLSLIAAYILLGPSYSRWREHSSRSHDID